MKIAIIGDIHGNLEALNAVLAKCQELEVTHYMCIGDVVGYNADPKACLDIVRQLNLLGIVMGNHDSYVSSDDDELLGFNPQAALAVFWTRRQLTQEDMDWLRALPMKKDILLPNIRIRVSLVHATMDNPNMWGYIFDRYTAEASLQYQWTPICFFGHSHVPLAFDKSDCVKGGPYEEVKLEPNHKYLINVGSVGQPRDRDPRAAFATYEPATCTVQLHRVEYDIDTCQKKIIAAGLPLKLAERLAIGR